MSLRKVLSLLLLVALSWTSITPAGATVSINSSATLPYIAQDPGTTTNGANRDVVPLVLKITFAGSDLDFATDAARVINGAVLGAYANGQVFINNGTLSSFANGTLAAPKVAIFVPPTGTKFVKLNAYNNSYADASNADAGHSILVNGSSRSTLFKNVTIDSAAQASFPGSGTNGIVLASIVGSAGASATVFGTGAATEFTEGSLIVNFITPADAPNTLASGAGGTITINGIGLAADPGSSLGSTGNIAVTYKEPNSSALAGEAFSSLNDGATYNVASLTSYLGKVEFLALGDKTGKETSTTAEPDSQPNNILAGSVTGTTLKVLPGGEVQGGSTSYVDTDALILRAAERPDSAVGSLTYFQTPFATSSFTTTEGATTSSILRTTADVASLRDISIEGNSSNFPNVSNAMMKVVFSLETATGATSTASLAVDAVNVSLVGPRAFDGIRNASSDAFGGDSTALTAAPLRRSGFLGAAIYPENGSTSSNDSRYGVAAVYNGTSAAAVYTVRDAVRLNYGLVNGHIAVANTSLFTSTVSAASSAATGISTVKNGTAAAGIFPGSLVVGANNGSAASSWVQINQANGVAHTTSTYALTAAANVSNIFEANDALQSPSEVTVRLVNGTSGASIGNAAWFTFTGNDDAGDETTAANSVEIASTNRSSSAYDAGWNAKTNNGAQATPDARNNAIMVTELDGATLRLLPLVNKYDAIRDAIVIRPEATITLDATSKTAGVRLIATATGGNLPTAGVRKVIAEVIATGGFDSSLDVTSTALPVHGTMGTLALMQESTTDAGVNRAAVLLSSVTGSTTSANEISDLLSTGNSLDTTTPPLFCGGTAGTTSKGPNGVVFQPKARAILISENGTSTTGFEDIVNLGSTKRVRVTLPSGWDLNAYNGSTAASEIVSLIATSGVSATVNRVQPIASGITQAFVDITISSVSSTTVATKKALGLVFKPNALVAPATVTSFNATVDVYDVGTANARDEALTADVLVGSLGTVALATECSTLLTLSFCDDKVSTFQATNSTATTVEATKVTNGARSTDFASTPSSAKRLINSASASSTVSLPDLCIEEGIADALPLGTANDGVPSAFGLASTTSIGTGRIHIATSLPVRVLGATDAIGLNGSTAAANILTSDSSIKATGAVTRVAGNDTLGNEVFFTVGEGTVSGRQRPFEEKTRIRVPGLTLDPAANSQSVSDQDFYAWFEAVTGTGEYSVGTSMPVALENVNTTTNDHFIATSNVTTSSEALKMSNFYSDRTADTTTGTITAVDWGDSDSTTATNNVRVATASTTAAKLTKAATAILDNTSYDTLSENTDLSVQVTTLTDASAGVNAKISAKAGSLEPGTLVSLSSAGSIVDSVTVPVLDDGSFVANLRAAAGADIEITQAPTTSSTTKDIQLVTVKAENANVDPVLASATASTIEGLGKVTARGTAPVVFTVLTSGISNGAEFAPVASELKLGGLAVEAVTGSSNEFIGVIDFSKSTSRQVTSTVAANTVSISIDDISSVPTLTGKPTLTSVKVNKKGFLVIKGKGLSNDGTFGFVLADGTFSPVDLQSRTADQAKKGLRRSAATASIPTNATHAVFHVAGKGISTVAI